MENYVVVVDHKDDAYGHQRSFLGEFLAPEACDKLEY